MRIPSFSHSCRPLVFSPFFIIAIIVNTKWYLIVVLMNISLLTDDVEHLFMYLLAIRLSSLEKCLFSYFAYLLKIGLFVSIIELQAFFIYSGY